MNAPYTGRPEFNTVSRDVEDRTGNETMESQPRLQVSQGLQQNNPSEQKAKPKRRRRRSSGGDLYSPKKVAAAIGVSESSLKRWCDAGYIQASKTAGGHRRVSRAEVVAFLKRKKYDLRDPSAIDLPDIRNVEIAGDVDAVQQVADALKRGDEEICRRLLVHMYISGRTVPDLYDRIITPAFEQIGDLWECGKLEIYQERVACQICLAAAMDIRSLVPPARDGAPLAIGCTLENDHYQLATIGVEMCLATFGWRAKSLGSNIPIESLYRAFEQQSPQLVWISISHYEDERNLIDQINHLSDRIANRAEIVVGGAQLDHAIRSQIRGVSFCDNFAQLILAAQNLSNRIR